MFILCFIVSCFLLVLPEDRFFEWNEQPQTNLRPEDYTRTNVFKISIPSPSSHYAWSNKIMFLSSRVLETVIVLPYLRDGARGFFLSDSSQVLRIHLIILFKS